MLCYKYFLVIIKFFSYIYISIFIIVNNFITMKKNLFLPVLVIFILSSLNSLFAVEPIDYWNSYSYRNSSLSYSGTTIYINSAADLAQLAYLVNNNTSDFSGKTVILLNDIDLGDHWWVPIGNRFYTGTVYSFRGIFDGNNKIISNLYINSPDSDNQGLFGFSNEGELKNIFIKNGDIIGRSYVGGISGYSSATISNCINNAIISAESGCAGGIVGLMGGTKSINNCINNGSINALSYAGGIVGKTDEYIYSSATSSITNCYNSGIVSANSLSGGITASSFSTISYCINTGNVFSNTGEIGAITGKNNGSLVDCYYDKQLCLVSEENNENGILEGLLTSEITGNGLKDKLDTITWVYKTNYYPQLKNFRQSATVAFKNASIFFSSPIYLASTEKCNSVKTNFEVPILTSDSSLSITWISSDTNSIACNATNINIKEVSSFTTVTLTATAGDLSKSVQIVNTNTPPITTKPYWVDLGAWDGVILTSENCEFGYWDSVNSSFNGSGDGLTEENPITIYHPSQLAFLADQVNTGNGIYNDKYIKVMADLDLGGVQESDESWNSTTSIQWIPIGNSNSRSFQGVFDGNNKSIKNIYINSSDNYQGLFGHANSELINVVVESGYIKGGDYNGGIIGYSNGLIDNCINNAEVHGGDYNGGIVGFSISLIDNCINNAEIRGKSPSGGIAGLSWNIISNCINNGSITGYDGAGSSSMAGGIVGQTNSLVSNCLNNGKVYSSYSSSSYGTHYPGKAYAGGIVGYTSSTITNCINQGYIYAYSGIYSKSYAGGIVANSTSSVLKCINKGYVNAFASVALYVSNLCATAYSGGIIGYSTSNINLCINSGLVRGIAESYYSYAGGIVGYMDSLSNVNTCLNTNNIIDSPSTFTSRYFGGIVGQNYGGTVDNNFYDRQMCQYGGINEVDTLGYAEGKLTNEIISSSLESNFGATNWSYTAGYYPQLKVISDSINNTFKSISTLTACPIYLDQTEFSWCITRDFTVPLLDAAGNSITWTVSDNSGLSLDNGTGIVTTNKVTSLTDVVLIATISTLKSASLRSATMIFYTKEFNLVNANLTTNDILNTSSSFRVYPNPVIDMINLQGANVGAEYSIYDIAGTILQKGIINSDNKEINVSSIKTGTYLLKINEITIPFIKK